MQNMVYNKNDITDSYRIFFVRKERNSVPTYTRRVVFGLDGKTRRSLDYLAKRLNTTRNAVIREAMRHALENEMENRLFEAFFRDYEHPPRGIKSLNKQILLLVSEEQLKMLNEEAAKRRISRSHLMNAIVRWFLARYK